MAESFRSPAKVARRIRLAPLVSRSVKNWPSFVYNYAIGLVPDSPYRFRNGAQIQIGRGVDHVPIIEIFLRSDYGPIPNNSVVIDLGANIGVFSIYAATTAKNVKLYAYEPMPDFFRLLQANVRLNGLGDSVECFNLAVAADQNERELFTSGQGIFFPTFVSPSDQAGRKSASVPCTTLAKILETHSLPAVDILKLDVEGAEYEILYGTTTEHLSRISEIRMEYHSLDRGEKNLEALKHFLNSSGFKITHEQPNTPTNGTIWAAR